MDHERPNPSDRDRLPTDSERDLDDLLDRAVASIQDDEPDDPTVRASAQRSWAAISAATGTVSGDEDLHALIPAYLTRELDEQRALLVADRIRRDPSFRADVEAERTGRQRRRSPADAPAPVQPAPAWLRPASWALAAALVLAVGAGTWLFGRDVIQPNRVMASVADVQGSMYIIDESVGRPLAAGDDILPRQAIRTDRHGGAVVTLTDGSRIELDERSEIALRSRWDGTAVALARGNVIVEAAPQREGHLYVTTDDTQVAVKGTIFAVRHGTKGSRVSVVEGEVAVVSGDRRATLTPGMQFSSSTLVGSVPVYQDVSWSRDAEQYRQILEALVQIGDEIEQTVARPGPRTTSRLMEMAPADSVVFVSLPNLGETFAESYGLFRQRVSENELLSQWWDERMDDPEHIETMDELVQVIGRFGGLLGDEIGIAVSLNDEGVPGMPVALAPADDPAAFMAELEAQLAAWSTEHGEDAPPIRIVNDPRVELPRGTTLDVDPNPSVPATDDDGGSSGVEDPVAADPSVLVQRSDALWIWPGDGMVVASPAPEQLLAVADALDGQRMPERFREGIAEAFGDGMDAVFAIDLGRIVAATSNGMDADEADLRNASGLDGLEYAFVTQVMAAGRSQLGATITFDGPRRGMAGWLAEPSSMGGLSYISPDATAVSAAVMQRPERIVAEILGTADRLSGVPGDPDARRDMDMMAELAAPLGGEVVFAIDGPLLPEPSWKLVLEVFDAPAMQAAIEHTVERINDRIREETAEGEPVRRLLLDESDVDGRTVWRIALDGADALAVHYTFADGYLIAAPGDGLIEHALRQRRSGLDITSSPAFREALPSGGELDFSALAWQDLGRLAGEAAQLAERAAEARGSELDLASTVAPSLVYAYAEADRIHVAGSSERNPLGIGALLGIGGMGFAPVVPGDALEDGVERELDRWERGLEQPASPDAPRAGEDR